MMAEATIDDEALGWAIRVADPDFDDWDTFTTWLEEDTTRHGRYDRAVVGLDEAHGLVAAAPHLPIAANDAAPPSRSYLRWGGGVVAATMIGVLSLSAWINRPQPYTVETAFGRQRSVALADGSEIVLAGGSRVKLDRNDVRVAVVEQGEMLFRIRHDASHPFQVSAGELSMTDIGTEFDVKLSGRRTRVAVAEGAVMVDPGGAHLRLDPGQAAVASGGAIRRESADDIAGWREGRLAFDDADLADVANDLSRHLGRSVRASSDVARRPFRGTLDLTSLRNDPDLLGRLLEVRVRVDGDDWMLERAR